MNYRRSPAPVRPPRVARPASRAASRSSAPTVALAAAVTTASLLAICGCGTMKNHTATEQLLMSDAVDQAVAQIDFHALGGQKVFLDNKYLQNTRDPAFLGNQKGMGFVNAEYVLSSLRQQMVACGCLVQDKADEADFVVEPRLGAVGIDSNELLFGVPASNALSTANTLVPNTPMIPAIPEIALAKRNISIGAAKIGVFAYHRTTREPVWQSGIAKATSTSKDTWILGAGPFQKGTIYETTQFAGAEFQPPIMLPLTPPLKSLPLISYQQEQLFQRPASLKAPGRAFEAAPVGFEDVGTLRPLDEPRESSVVLEARPLSTRPPLPATSLTPVPSPPLLFPTPSGSGTTRGD